MLFIVVDLFRTLPGFFMIGHQLEDVPLPKFLIAAMMLNLLISFLTTLANRGTERELVISILRNFAFAVIPFIPGYMIKNEVSLLTKFVYICLLPLIGFMVEATLLEGVLTSCGQSCIGLKNNPLVQQILFFSFY